jgi:cytochrome P450
MEIHYYLLTIHRPYLRATIKESMRLTPTVTGISRVFNYPVEVEGYEIPPQTIIAMLSWNANQSSDFFEQEKDFKPERYVHQVNINIISYIHISS